MSGSADMTVPARSHSGRLARPVRQLTADEARSGEALRKRRLEIAASDDAPSRQVAERMGVYGDAAKGLLRTWRTDAGYAQATAAEYIGTLIPPKRQGWMLATDSLSRLERERSRALSMTIETLIAARLALGRSLAEWGADMERAVRQWEREKHIGANTADARHLARMRDRDATISEITEALPRLGTADLSYLVRTVRGLEQGNGTAGHRTPAEAYIDWHDETERLAHETPRLAADTTGDEAATGETPDSETPRA